MTTPSPLPTSPPPPSPPVPHPPSRFLTPDLARGLMLALIAVANVMLYLHVRPSGPHLQGFGDDGWDRVVGAGVTAVVDSRAYPLFAALFGYGLVQMARRRRDRGHSEESVRRSVRRRGAALIAVGAAHALLAFPGDILGLYGLLGLVSMRLLTRSDRSLLWLAGLWLVPASAVQGYVLLDPPGMDGGTIFASFAIPDPLSAAGWRMVEWVMTPFGLLSAPSALLVGAWAARRRLLERPEQHRPLLLRTAVVGIASGLLGGTGMALVTAEAISPPAAAEFALSWLHIVSGVVGGLGYAALIALLAVQLQRRGTASGPVVRALRATGERSLSAYLAQSAVFAALLPAAALGWGADIGPTAAALLALLTWALTVLASARLARAGRSGPAEALLRRLISASPRHHSRATITS